MDITVNMKLAPSATLLVRAFPPHAKPARKTPARKSEAACAATLIVSLLLATPWLPVRAQTISLGEAQNTAVLGSSTVTNTGATTVVGNLALSPGSSVTGFNPPGTVIDGAIHINDALAVQAHADAFTAYTTLAGEAQTGNLSGTNLGGLILTPGVYRFDSTAQLTGTLFLDTRNDPNGTFIFQIGSSLATAPNSAVTLLGASGSDPNIFWQVGSSATVGINTIFDGNIVALTSISLAAGADITLGRALAINGAVTMDTNVVNSTGALITGAFWNGGAGNLWSGANWSPDTTGATSSTLLPGFDVVFSVTGIVPQNQNTVLDVNETISSLTVNDAVAVTISGPNTLSILGSGLTRGITINNGAGLVTINSDLQLGGQSQGITVNNVAGLVINGMVSGTIGLTKAGSGLLTLTAAEGYTGSTLITAGTLQLGDGITAGTSIASSGPVTIDGGAVLALDLKSGETFGNAVTDGGLVTTIAPGTNTLSGVISGAGAFAQNGIGLSILSGVNTYTGGTTVASGVLSVASKPGRPERRTYGGRRRIADHRGLLQLAGNHPQPDATCQHPGGGGQHDGDLPRHPFGHWWPASGRGREYGHGGTHGHQHLQWRHDDRCGEAADRRRWN
jgi:autotransporter-associated beta strand protein